jgi:hypothetical protein
MIFVYLMLCLSMPQERMGNRGLSPLFLNISTKCGEWSLSCPGHFTHSVKELSVHAEKGHGVGLGAC